MGKVLIGIVGGLLAGSLAWGEVRQRVMVAYSEPGLVGIVDPATGSVEARVRVGLAPRGVAVSSDGRLAVVANRGLASGGSSLSVIDLVHLRLARMIRLNFDLPTPTGDGGPLTFHRPESVCFVGETLVLVTCPPEGALLVVDVKVGAVVGMVETGGLNPWMVLPGPEGRRAYVSNTGSGTVSIVDVGRHRVIDTFETGTGAAGMALHPVRNELWVANSGSNSISVVDLDTLRERAEFACGAAPARLVFTEDGRYCLCANQGEGSISVFSGDGESFRVVHEVVLDPPASTAPVETANAGEDLGGDSQLARGCGPVGMVLAPGGESVFVSCTRAGHVAEVDIATWAVRRYVEVGAGPRGLAWWRSEHDVVSAK